MHAIRFTLFLRPRYFINGWEHSILGFLGSRLLNRVIKALVNGPSSASFWLFTNLKRDTITYSLTSELGAISALISTTKLVPLTLSLKLSVSMFYSKSYRFTRAILIKYTIVGYLSIFKANRKLSTMISGNPINFKSSAFYMGIHSQDPSTSRSLNPRIGWYSKTLNLMVTLSSRCLSSI